MKFIKTHKAAVILSVCTIFVVALLIFFGTNSSRVTASEDALRTTMSPIQKFFSNIGHGLYDVTHCIGDLKELRTQNDDLTKKNTELERKLTESSELSDENDRLKRMLELRHENPEFDVVAATVAASEPSNWFASFTIDKGRNSGIEQGLAVISGDGSLVGKISKVGSNWSEVVTIVDPGFSAGSKVERSNNMGVAEGDAELRFGGNLKLSYLNRETDIKVNDYICTTGLGGVFPDGLRIGKVMEVKEDNVNMNRYAIIEPSTSLNDLRNVFVIRNSFDLVADRENDNMKSARKTAEEEQDKIDKEKSADPSPGPSKKNNSDDESSNSRSSNNSDGNNSKNNSSSTGSSGSSDDSSDRSNSSSSSASKNNSSSNSSSGSSNSSGGGSKNSGASNGSSGNSSSQGSGGQDKQKTELTD